MVSNPNYRGHYVLLVNADFDNIHYLCPTTKGEKKMSYENFQVSRKAYGTD